jgi:hypothetical protein
MSGYARYDTPRGEAGYAVEDVCHPTATTRRSTAACPTCAANSPASQQTAPVADGIALTTSSLRVKANGAKRAPGDRPVHGDRPHRRGVPTLQATYGVQPTPAPPTVRAWSCMACRTNWATTVINPVLSIVGLLPTPALRTVALLATLRTEVTRRSEERPSTMTATIYLPATEVISVDAMASVDTVVWWCRLCDQHGITTTKSTAHSDAIEHLTAQHHATTGGAP